MTVLLYDSAALIDSVKNNAHLPETASSGSADADILRFLNEQLKMRLLPALLAVREEYVIVSERITLAASTTRYRIPKRAAGNRLRGVFYVSSTGVRQKLPKINRDNIDRYGSTSQTIPRAYYLEGNHMVMVPDLNATPEGYLEVSYPFAAADIVDITETRIISNVNTGTGAITCSAALPGSWTNALYYDIHGPNSGSEIRVFDIKPTTVATPTLTFAAADINGSGFGKYIPLVGDYICLAGECALPPLPKELHPVLSLAAAAAMDKANGDLEHAQGLQEEMGLAFDAIISHMLEDRVDADPEVIVNRQSFLGGSAYLTRQRKDEF